GDLGQPAAGVGPVGVVVGPEPLGTVVAAGQVDQLPADLGRRQVVEVPDTLGPDLGQAPVEPHEGGLEQVVGLLPPPDVREAPQHGAGQGHEPRLGQRDQLVTGQAVASAEPVEQVARLSVLAHGPAPSGDPAPFSGGLYYLIASPRAGQPRHLGSNRSSNLILPSDPMDRLSTGAVRSRILPRDGATASSRSPGPRGLTHEPPTRKNVDHGPRD